MTDTKRLSIERRILDAMLDVERQMKRAIPAAKMRLAVAAFEASALKAKGRELVDMCNALDAVLPEDERGRLDVAAQVGQGAQMQAMVLLGEVNPADLQRRVVIAQPLPPVNGNHRPRIIT